MIVVVEFYFFLDYFLISMLKFDRKLIQKKRIECLVLHRALVSVLIDGDGEFGDERTLGFEYWFWWSRIVGGRDSIEYPWELFSEDVNWLGDVVEEFRL